MKENSSRIIAWELGFSCGFWVGEEMNRVASIVASRRNVRNYMYEYI